MIPKGIRGIEYRINAFESASSDSGKRMPGLLASRPSVGPGIPNPGLAGVRSPLFSRRLQQTNQARRSPEAITYPTIVASAVAPAVAIITQAAVGLAHASRAIQTAVAC